VRLLLGALALAGLFAGAWWWQRGFTAAARVERERLRSGAGSGSAGDRREGEDGWGRVVVGRPSGAEPVEPRPQADPARPGDAGRTGQAVTGDAAAPPPHPDREAEPPGGPTGAGGNQPGATAQEFRMVVQPGQNLSSICRVHYGTARPELVRAVARYNQLASEHDLRAGRTLLLPPIEKLLPAGGR
jgi:hypothetical protein